MVRGCAGVAGAVQLGRERCVQTSARLCHRGLHLETVPLLRGKRRCLRQGPVQQVLHEARMRMEQKRW